MPTKLISHYTAPFALSNGLPLDSATKLKASAATSLVIFDSQIDDLPMLLADVDPDREVVILDPERDGIEQVTTALAQRPQLAQVHLVAHGSPGQLLLGNSSLDLAATTRSTEQLQAWSHALQGRDLLIYGCQVAEGVSGALFLQQLHSLTGANIAASKCRVGRVDGQPQWQLETKIGPVTTSVIFSRELQSQYQGSFEETPNVTVSFEVTNNAPSTDPTNIIEENGLTLVPGVPPTAAGVATEAALVITFGIEGFLDGQIPVVRVETGQLQGLTRFALPALTPAGVGPTIVPFNEEEEILLNSTADLQILANGATISLPIVNSPEAAVDPTDIPNETESVDFTFTPQGGIELSDTLISVPTNVPLDFTVNSDTEFVETFNFFETIAAFEDFVPDPANTPPVAVDDSATTDEDVAVIIDVLANDSDPDPEDVLSIDTVTEGANGTVTINDDGTLTYTPDTGFSGTDSFTYTISDAEGATSTATVSVTVGLDDIPATPDLDVDGDGDVVAAVDILNIFRVLAGAPQAVVVPDGIAIDQQAIADAVEALPDSALDVDGFGGVTPAVDILNIFRVLAGAPQAVVVTDEASANGATQQTIADAVNDLL